MCCFDDHVMLYHILARLEFQVLYLLHLILSVCMKSVKNLSGTTAVRKLKIHE